MTKRPFMRLFPGQVDPVSVFNAPDKRLVFQKKFTSKSESQTIEVLSSNEEAKAVVERYDFFAGLHKNDLRAPALPKIASVDVSTWPEDATVAADSLHSPPPINDIADNDDFWDLTLAEQSNFLGYDASLLMANVELSDGHRNTADSEVNDQVKNPVISKKAKKFFAPFDSRPQTLRSETSAISVALKNNVASIDDTKVTQPVIPQSSLGKLPSNKDVFSTVPADGDANVGQPIIPHNPLGNPSDLQIPEDMWTFMNNVEMRFLKRINATHAVDLLLLAQKYNFTELKDACIKKIAYYMRETDENIHVEKLPADIAKEILITMNFK